MNSLDVSRINARAPYVVSMTGSGYSFQTDTGIVYSVTFDVYTDIAGSIAYWFALTNLSFKASPNDVKLKEIVVCIIEEFFDKNPDILLYLCDTAKGQQAMRNRLFQRWFNTYELRQRYYVLNEMIPDEDADNYVTLIIQRSNPQFEQIVSFFNDIISQFKSNKP